MKRRTVDSLIVTGVVLALVGGAMLYASQRATTDSADDSARKADQAAQIAARQAERLRMASIEDCRRSNDVRADLIRVKEGLRKLVEVVINGTGAGSPDAQKVFERVHRELRKPVPLVECQAEYPRGL